jgi:hypothetical protein
MKKIDEASDLFATNLAGIDLIGISMPSILMHAWVLAFGAAPSGTCTALRTGRSLRLHTLYTINDRCESEMQKIIFD